MTIQQLEKLIDAGFTKEEIYQLEETENSTDQPGTPEQSNNETDDQSAAEDQPESNNNDTGNQDKPENNGAAVEARVAGVEKKIDDLIKAIQRSNLKNDSFNDPGDSLEDATDKIMQSIIRPNIGKDGRND